MLLPYGFSVLYEYLIHRKILIDYYKYFPLNLIVLNVAEGYNDFHFSNLRSKCPVT